MKSMILRGAVVAVAAIGLAGCTAYDNWGYGGVSVGYGSGYYEPYYGWYDGYYYPGTGYYIYDRYGSRHRWSDRYRRYWEQRRPDRGYRAERRADRREYRQERRVDRREYRQERREDRREYRRERREDRRGRR